MDSNHFQKIKEVCQKKKGLDKKRLNEELEKIRKMNLVDDFYNLYLSKKRGKENKVNSLVAFALGITSQYPAGQFSPHQKITKGRINMPDIDLDFADTRRDEVVHYIESKYGKNHVAGIITFGTLAARAAVRDVGRVLGYPYSFCDKLAKMVPPNMPLGKSRQLNQELASFIETNQDAKIIIDAAQKLEGVARHSSRHACGIVITPQALTEYVPLQYDVSNKEKTIISQYEMHAIEDLGLLKMDILGLRNLTIIEQTINLIKKTKNIDIDLEKIPLDDKKTFSLLQKGETIGCFQLESSGMRGYLRELRPTNFEDIIAMVALYRPGPMKLIPDYIAGKHGKKKITYLHPKLRPILEKTYGVAIFQEQLLEIVRSLAGFSLSEADVLRKAIGKKIKNLLDQQKEKFIKGCLENKIPESLALKIFSFIEPFANYGFNRSHAVCYALIAYQTAYLKAHWPTEFMAALLTSDQDNLDRISIEVEEARRMNIKVLGPDINESFENFTPRENKIHFGLLAIKNVGRPIVQEIIKERKKNGNFTSLENFLSRIHSKNLNKKSLESLIKSGALDSLYDRNTLVANLDILLDFSRHQAKDKDNGQKSLFAKLGFKSHLSLKLKKPTNISFKQELFWEKELLGIFVSQHPLKEYEALIKKYIKPIAQLENNSQVKILGVIEKVEKKTTYNHQPMLFVEISDSSAQIEALVFPSLYQGTAKIWQEGNILIIEGRISDKEGKKKIIVENVRQIDEDSLSRLALNN